MKLPLAFTIMAIAALPAGAWAQSNSDEGDVSINGTVAPLCILGDPAPALVDLGQMAETSGLRVGRVRTIANQTVTLPNSFCNFAGSVVTIEASAMLTDDPTAPQSGFARAVNYTATANGWASLPSTTTTSALGDGSNPDSSGFGSTQPLPNIADIEVELSGFSVPGDALMVADNYSGLVTVTLGPAPLVN